MTKSIFMTSLLLAVSCGISAAYAIQPTSVNGGEVVKSGDVVAKSTVSVFGSLRADGSLSYCVGTILAEDIILTTASCVLNFEKNSEMAVGFGRDLRTSHLVVTRSSIVHDQFRADVTDPDIALVRFSGGLPSGFKPAFLPVSGFQLAIDSLVTVVGFGRREPQGPPRYLKKIQLRVAKDEEPSKIFFKQTKEYGVDYGTSGGPAFMSSESGLVVVGISSWLSRDREFSIFEPVALHIDWIAEASQKLRKL